MTAVFAHRGCTGRVHREHPGGLRRGPAAGGRRGRARRAPDAPTGPWSSTTTPRSPGVGPRRPSWRCADLPGPRAAPGRRAGRLRGHGGQRRDQERARRPGYDPGEAVAALTAAAIERGRLDRAGRRLVLPARDAPGRAGRRRPAGARARCWRVRRRPGPALGRGRRGGLPGRAPLRDRGRRPDLVAQAHAAGLAVNVWTVNAARRPASRWSSWGWTRSSPTGCARRWP